MTSFFLRKGMAGGLRTIKFQNQICIFMTKLGKVPIWDTIKGRL